MKRTTMQIFGALVFTALTLTACEDMGHMYPANALATARGEAVAHFSSYGTGHGGLEIILPGNEIFRGSYAPAAVGVPFGSVFKAVYGEYSVLPTAADKGTPSTSSLSSNRGTTMQCEFYNDDYTGHGFGACQTSLGAQYKLQY